MKIRKVLKRMGSMAMALVFTISSVCFESTANADSISWTKVDGIFINSAGDEIEGAILKGIDVSYHNKEIDWQQVKDSDVDYAIIRCGYGQDFESQDDSKWEEYATACTELGIPFGTYLFSYATTVEAAESEARHVLRVIDGYKLTYPVYYDMEESKQGAVSAKRKAQMAEAFCSILEQAGYQTGIYANTNWFNTKLTDSYFDTRDKWVAQYNSVCKYEGSYRMWQCTSEGSVPGISGNVDINFWFDQPPVYQGNTPNITEDNQTASNTENNQGTQIGDNTSQPVDNPDNNQIIISPVDSQETPPLSSDNNQEIENPDSSQVVQNPTGNDNQETQIPDHIQTPEETVPSTPKEPEKVVISQNTLTLSYGGTSVLTANQKVTWSSSDDTVVDIDSEGSVTPIGIGEAVIMAVAEGGKSAECKVTIKKPIKDVDIEAIPDQQYTGKQIRPTIAITDEEKELVKGTDYKITYTDNVAKGTAVITIKGKGYYTGSTTKSFQIVPKKKLKSPTLIEISSSKNTVTLKWKKVSQANGYEIYRATKKNGEYTLQTIITKKSKVTYKDKKLIKGKKYYYKIRTYKDENGQRQYSSYIKMKIKAA